MGFVVVDCEFTSIKIGSVKVCIVVKNCFNIVILRNIWKVALGTKLRHEETSA